MDDRKVLNLAIMVGLLLILLAGLVGLIQATPARAAPVASAWETSGTSGGAERISLVPADLPARPGLVLPPSLPPGGPLLQTPVLTITKSANPNPVNAGSMLVYTIVVRNSGDTAATGTIITDGLDAQVSFVSASDGGTSNSGVVTWSPVSVGAGLTITRSLQVKVASNVPNGTSLSNTANVTSTEGTHDSYTLGTQVEASADLSITKSDTPDPVIAGNQLTYQVQVSNAGPSDAVNVRVTDTLPGGVSFVSTSGCVGGPNGVPTCSLGDIPAGGSKSYTILVTVNPGTLGSITNTATVSSNTPDPDPSDNTTTESTQVQASADLSITKSDTPDPVIAGNQLIYQVQVSNAGPSNAVNVRVTDTLPGGVSFVSTSGCVGGPNGVPTCSLGDIPAGGSKSYTILVTVNPGTLGSITNTATVSSNTPDPDPSDNTTTESTQVQASADLRITKTDSSDPVVAGSWFSYNLSIRNNGPSNASGVRASDQLPAGLTFRSSDSSSQCSAVGQQVICTVGNLSANGTENRTIAVDAAAWLAEGPLSNTASVSGDQTDPSMGNNSSTQATAIIRRPDLGVSLSDSADPVGIGGSFTYHVTVTNHGPSDASGVSVSDTLPAELSFKSSGSSSECSLTSPQVVTCEAGNLAAGLDVALTVAVDVDDALADGTLLSNTVIVSANETDPNGGNDSATEGTLSKVFKTYLPVILRSLTELSVFNDNTGGDVTFTVVGAGVSCVVPNNTTQFCGSFEPGTYTVRVSSLCGEAEAVKTYQSGPVITRVYCK